MAGEEERPRLTAKQVEEWRANLHGNFKRLKKAYEDAIKPTSDSEARVYANEWIARMWSSMEDVKRQYQSSDVVTTSVEYAANELLSELRVYGEALDETFTVLPLVGFVPQASPISADPDAPGNTGRLLPSCPLEGQVEAGTADGEGDPNRTRRNLDLSETTRSKASSITKSAKGSRKSSSRSSTYSAKSTQARKQRDEDLDKERERREEDKANNDLLIEDLRRQIEEVKRKERLDVKLHEAKKASIEKAHEEQQRLIEQEEEEEEEEDQKLEFTVEGLNLGGGNPGDRTKAWAEQMKQPSPSDPATSTVKKDRSVQKSKAGLTTTFVIEETESVCSGKSEQKRKKGKAQASVKTHHGPQTARSHGKVVMAAKEAKEEVSRGAEMLRREVKELEEKLRVKREEMLEQVEEEKKQDEVGCERKDERGFSQFMEIQARMAAITTLQAIRPKIKFASGRRTDFAKQMKLLEGAFETPAATPRMKLQELPFYFEGSALKLIEADVIRKDAKVALREAIQKLEKKFGVRRETALEMLEELLAGKPLGEKDHNALLDFYARLQSIYSLAKETGRSADFEARSVVDAILKKKIPHLMVKWFKKSVRHLRDNGKDLGFEDFLQFVDEEHAVAELMAKAMGGAQSGQKQIVGAKVAATSIQEGGRTGMAAAKASGCRACGAGHALQACEAFRDMGAAEKRKLCQVGEICYKCLGSGHAARFCKEEGQCGKCSRQHHTSVHNLFAPQAKGTDGGSA